MSNLHQRVHSQCRFNDNGDGTLSIAQTPVNIGEQLPAVVSAKHLNPTELSMEYPQVPYYPGNVRHVVWKNYTDPAIMERDTSASTTPLDPGHISRASSANTSRPATKPPEIKDEDGTNQIYKHIRPFVFEPFFAGEVTSAEESLKEVLRLLMRLPLMRQLDWNPEYKGPRLVCEPREIIAITVQLVGEESARECSGCRLNTVQGPWLSCVFVPLEATGRDIPNKWSCANCLFMGRGVLTCSTAKLSKQRLERSAPAPASTSVPAQAPPPALAPGSRPKQSLTHGMPVLDDDVVIIREIPRQVASSHLQDEPTMTTATTQGMLSNETTNMEETVMTQSTRTSLMPTPQAMSNATDLHRGEEYVAPKSLEARLEAIESQLENLASQLANPGGKKPSNKKRRRESSEEEDDDEGDGNSSDADTSEAESSTSEDESSSEEDDISAYNKKLVSQLEKMLSRTKKNKKASQKGKYKKTGKPRAKKAKVARKEKKDSKKTKRNKKH